MMDINISIHALLTESDTACNVGWSTRQQNFNPRSPHGERLELLEIKWELGRFQSTLSSRRATCIGQPRRTDSPDFNPRSPHGERH